MKLYIEIGVVVLVIVVAGGYFLFAQKDIAPTACTQEAKQCPDGSYVGRTGPNCEFAECPEVAEDEGIDTSNWKTYRNEEGGYSFLAPESWQIGTSSTEADFTILLPPDRVPNPDREYFADIVIDSTPNPVNLNLVEFYEVLEPFNLFENSGAQTFFEVNSLEAVRFNGILGMLPSTVVAVKMDGRIIEITDVNENHQTDGIFDAIVDSIIPL